MNFIEKLKITIAKPYEYSKFNNSSFTDIIKIQAVGIALTIIIVNILKIVMSVLFDTPLSSFYQSDLNIIVEVIGTLILSIVQFNVLSLLYTLIFMIIDLFSRRKIGFKTTYIYANHIQVVCIVLGTFMGNFVLLLGIAYYIIALKKANLSNLIGG